jgi:hypothetical protein
MFQTDNLARLIMSKISSEQTKKQNIVKLKFKNKIKKPYLIYKLKKNH